MRKEAQACRVQTCSPVANADLQPLIDCEINGPVRQECQERGSEPAIQAFDPLLCQYFAQASCSNQQSCNAFNKAYKVVAASR